MEICISQYSAMDRKRILLLLEILSLLVIAFSQSGLGLENIAEYKYDGVSQSTVGENKQPTLAVDGNPSTEYHACALTDRFQSNIQAYWTVDLGKAYDIYSVVIYHRALFPGRLDNSDIVVSNMRNPTVTNSNTCGTIYMANRSDGPKDVVICTRDSAGRPIRGRYVTIKRQSNSIDPFYLNLCEVQVMSCPEGYWGVDEDNRDNDCQYECPNCASGDTCGVVDGYCYNCEQERWGDKCEKNCNCKEGSECQHDGYCSQGCLTGFGGYQNCARELPAMPTSFRQEATFKLNQDNSADITFEAASLRDYVTKYRVQARSPTDTSWIEVGVIESTLSPVTVNLKPISPEEKYAVRVIPFIMDGRHEVEGIASQPTEYMILDSSENSSDDGSNTGIIAGIAVIAVVLVILIVIVVILFVRKQRRSRKDNRDDNQTVKKPGNSITSHQGKAPPISLQAPNNGATYEEVAKNARNDIKSYENTQITTNDEDKANSRNIENMTESATEYYNTGKTNKPEDVPYETLSRDEYEMIDDDKLYTLLKNKNINP